MIRNFKPEDFPQALDLHEKLLSGHNGEQDYDTRLPGLINDLANALVDEEDRKIVGLVAYSPFWFDRSAYNMVVDTIRFMQHRSDENIAARIKSLEQENDHSYLAFYQDFPIHHYEPWPNDIYINSLAALPDFCGQGRGQRLLEAAIRKSARHLLPFCEGIEGKILAPETISLPPKAIYLHCPGDIKKFGLFGKAGFEPILFEGPIYGNGQPGHLMGRFI